VLNEPGLLSTVTGYRLDDQGSIPRGVRTIPFTTMFRLALWPYQPPIQWVPGNLSLGIKQPRHEADYSPPPCDKVKNVYRYTSIPPYIFMAWWLISLVLNETERMRDTIIAYSEVPSWYLPGLVKSLG